MHRRLPLTFRIRSRRLGSRTRRAVAAAVVVGGLVAGPILPSPAGAAPPGNANWLLGAGGVSSDSIDDVAVDAAGNTYVAGTFVLNMSMGGTNQAAVGNADAFVAKVGPSGNLLWLRKVGGASNDRAVAIEVDPSGNPFVAGVFRGSMTVAGQTVVAGAEGDSFVVKYDTGGTAQWVRTVSGASDSPADLAVTPEGDVTLAGTFSGSATAGASTVSSTSVDVFVARWSGAGAARWLRSGGSPADEDSVSLAPAASQVILAAGQQGQSGSYGGMQATVPPGRTRSVAVVAYGSDGTVGWARTIHGDQTIIPVSLAVHPAQGIVVGGTFSGHLTSGSKTVQDSGTTDAFLAGFSPTGQPTRLDVISGTGSDMVTNARFDEAGNLATSVRITGTIALGGVAHAPQGPADQVVTVFGPSRDVLWTSRISGPGQDPVTGLAVAPDGDLVVVGASDEEVTVAGTTLSLGGTDGWVGRIEDPTPAVASLRYRSLAPVRVLDSRKGTGGYSTPWGPGATRSVKVAGTLGVPAGAAVVLNLTATQPTAATHLTVSPTGSPRASASNLNVVAGQTAANLVVARVSGQGFVDITNNAGSTHLVADVVGVYQADTTQSEYVGMAPRRLLDSRNGTGGYTTPWPAATPRDVTVAGVGGSGIPANATAVVLNVTVENPSAATHLTVWPAGTAKPIASNLNLGAGETRANLVFAKVGANGRVSIANNSGTANVIADAVGYFTTAGTGLFAPLAPARVLDTRDGTGTFTTPFAAAAPRSVKVAGVGGVPATASSVVLNVTAVAPTAATHLTVWPTGQTKPLASTLNVPAGATVPNLVVAKVGIGGLVDIVNNSGSAHVVVDVVGWTTP